MHTNSPARCGFLRSGMQAGIAGALGSVGVRSDATALAGTAPVPAAGAGDNPYHGYAALRIHLDAGIAFVTIAHPPLNVLDAVLMTELDRFAGQVSGDVSVRVVVFQSADPDFFIPHGDMNFTNDPAAFSRLQLGSPGGLPVNPMMRLHERIRQLPQVTIGKLHGFAHGGGSEFFLSLDMRFAALGSAGLAQPEVQLSIIPGAGATAYLPRLIGRPRALEVILGADLFDAKTAAEYGWINRALPSDRLDGFVDRLARRIAGLAPGVAAAAKSAVDAASASLPEALIKANELLGIVFTAPGAAARANAALAAGAQTRQGELDLEGLLDKLPAAITKPLP